MKEKADLQLSSLGPQELKNQNNQGKTAEKKSKK
jgi:hypothetical protein